MSASSKQKGNNSSFFIFPYQTVNLFNKRIAEGRERSLQRNKKREEGNIFVKGRKKCAFFHVHKFYGFDSSIWESKQSSPNDILAASEHGSKTRPSRYRLGLGREDTATNRDRDTRLAEKFAEMSPRRVVTVESHRVIPSQGEFNKKSLKKKD